MPQTFDTITATIDHIEDIGYYRTPIYVAWLADITVQDEVLEGQSYLHVTAALDALLLRKGDRIQFRARVWPNTAHKPKGGFAEAMQARRSAYLFRYPRRYRILSRA